MRSPRSTDESLTPSLPLDPLPPSLPLFLFARCNPVFPVVTWYDYARTVDVGHPEYELRCGTATSTSIWFISYAFTRSVCHPTHAVWCVLLGGPAYGVLIGACDPMLCPNWGCRYPNGSRIVWGDPGANGGGHIGDFSTAGWRAAWSNGMLDTIKTGAIDGDFIDGFRGDAAAGAMGPPAGPTCPLGGARG